MLLLAGRVTYGGGGGTADRTTTGGSVQFLGRLIDDGHYLALVASAGEPPAVSWRRTGHADV